MSTGLAIVCSTYKAICNTNVEGIVPVDLNELRSGETYFLEW